MPGTREGAAKAKIKILARNPNHFREMGAAGGRKSRGGGYAAKAPCSCDEINESHTKPQCSGLKGGRVSRRRSATQVVALGAA